MTQTSGKLTTLFLSVLGCIFWATASTIAEPIPTEILIDQLADLYTPVVFDHLTHSESYECNRCHHESQSDEQNGCSTCHAGRPVRGEQQCSTCHTATSGKETNAPEDKRTYQYHIDTPALKGSWHLLCRRCHIEDGGPIGCRDCHTLSAKGQEFFKLTK